MQDDGSIQKTSLASGLPYMAMTVWEWRLLVSELAEEDQGDIDLKNAFNRTIILYFNGAIILYFHVYFV